MICQNKRIPNHKPVFEEVFRVLRAYGLYRLSFSNPFRAGIDGENWCGDGYAIHHPYDTNRSELWVDELTWAVEGRDGRKHPVAGPKESHHTLSRILNALIKRKFTLLQLWETTGSHAPDIEAEAGSWEHFIAIAPPYLELWIKI